MKSYIYPLSSFTKRDIEIFSLGNNGNLSLVFMVDMTTRYIYFVVGPSSIIKGSYTTTLEIDVPQSFLDHEFTKALYDLNYQKDKIRESGRSVPKTSFDDFYVLGVRLYKENGQPFQLTENKEDIYRLKRIFADTKAIYFHKNVTSLTISTKCKIKGRVYIHAGSFSILGDSTIHDSILVPFNNSLQISNSSIFYFLAHAQTIQNSVLKSPALSFKNPTTAIISSLFTRDGAFNSKIRDVLDYPHLPMKIFIYIYSSAFIHAVNVSNITTRNSLDIPLLQKSRYYNSGFLIKQLAGLDYDFLLKDVLSNYAGRNANTSLVYNNDPSVDLLKTIQFNYEANISNDSSETEQEYLDHLSNTYNEKDYFNKYSQYLSQEFAFYESPFTPKSQKDVFILDYEPDYATTGVSPNIVKGKNKIGLALELENNKKGDLHYLVRHIVYNICKHYNAPTIANIASPYDVGAEECRWVYSNILQLKKDPSLSQEGIKIVLFAKKIGAVTKLLYIVRKVLENINSIDNKIVLHPQTAGLHIYISKYKTLFHKNQKSPADRLLRTILYNPLSSTAGRSLLKYSLRTPSNREFWDFANVPLRDTRKEQAVNFSNENTIEFRFFGGGVLAKPNRIISWIFFCKALVDFTILHCKDPEIMKYTRSIKLPRDQESPNPLTQKFLDWIKESDYAPRFFAGGGNILQAMSLNLVQDFNKFLTFILNK